MFWAERLTSNHPSDLGQGFRRIGRAIPTRKDLRRRPRSHPAAAIRGGGRLLAELIAARSDWVGHSSVIEPGRTWMRTLSG
jgi:hypothetical protein